MKKKENFRYELKHPEENSRIQNYILNIIQIQIQNNKLNYQIQVLNYQLNGKKQ